MDLFIANVTAQDRIFHWRDIESGKINSPMIRAGQQEQILRDKSPEQVHSVIEHYRIYGMVTHEEARRMTREGKQITLIYSSDKPLPIEVYSLASEINEDIAARDVQIQKEKAAYAFGKGIQEDMTGLKDGIAAVELEIVEEAPKDPYAPKKERVKQTFKTTIKS